MTNIIHIVFKGVSGTSTVGFHTLCLSLKLVPLPFLAAATQVPHGVDSKSSPMTMQQNVFR